ncbi:MAG: hypothetical protein VKJ02_05035 [Snowella sp.]|nr:hypothetical protein [Snowella sp.]
MIYSISKVFTIIKDFFKQIKIKQALFALSVTFLFLILNVNPVFSEQSLGSKINEAINDVFDQNNSDDANRPKTAGEWDQQARETEGRPVEKLKRIGEQSAEAFKEFGAVYPDTAERSADALEDNLKNSKNR